jgi:UDP-N-acetylmuramate--alanine ligase
MSGRWPVGGDARGETRGGWDRTPRAVHLVGVGGAGMSGLARLLLAGGHRVTGSDRSESATLEALRALGAEVWAGHDGARMGRPDLVAASTAIRATNPELVAARILDIPVLGRAQLLALLMAGKDGIAVAGTHGKTTTTGMVVAILEAAGLDPSFAVGGDFKSSGSNAAAGSGPHFVAEADESDGSFLELAPTVAVVTNVEADHLDHWGDLAAVTAAFRSFVGRLPPDGTAVLCADDPGALDLAGAARCRVVTYGFAAGAEVRGELLAIDGRGASFAVLAGGEPLGEVALVVPGRHNVANALGAIAAAMAAGAPFGAAAPALAGFTGAARRFHLRAEVGGVTVVDDYAHHPTEVAASLAAARLGGAKRLVAVFQPHLYSRTRLFAAEFGRALAAADLVVVTDVYAAREDPEPGIDGALVAGAARHARADLDCVYEPDRSALATRVATLVQPGDLVLTLGAGDITTLADELAPLLPGRTAR